QQECLAEAHADPVVRRSELEGSAPNRQRFVWTIGRGVDITLELHQTRIVGRHSQTGANRRVRFRVLSDAQVGRAYLPGAAYFAGSLDELVFIVRNDVFQVAERAECADQLKMRFLVPWISCDGPPVVLDSSPDRVTAMTLLQVAVIPQQNGVVWATCQRVL